MARLLRRLLLIEVVTLTSVALLLCWLGVLGGTAAAALAIGIAFLAHSFFAVGGFVIAPGQVPAVDTKTRSSLLVLRSIAREWLAFQWLMVVIQPFERSWMGKEQASSRSPDQLPALLIHGYFCNRGAWWWMRSRLRARGFEVATMDLEPSFGDIDVYADQLHRRVETLCAETGAHRVALICHSMGGLAARAYLGRHGSCRVAKLATLATPHRGTSLAYLGLGRNAQQMRPGNPWLAALKLPDADLPTLAIWSPVDNFIAPQESARLEGAREIMMPGLGHLSMLFSSAILSALTEELASRSPAPADGPPR
jgi:triacylglycerol lipase